MSYFKNIINLDDLKSQYKTLARKNHPDAGGDPEVMKAINQEYDKLFPIWRDRFNATAVQKNYETGSSSRSEFYTQNGWKGEKNDRRRSTKEVAALVREYVKTNYPTWKFSIRFSSASMCSEIHTELKEAPEKIWKEYSELTYEEKIQAWSLASRNWYIKRTEIFDDLTDQELAEAYKNINFLKVYTEYAKHVIDDIEREVQSYNYEDCDGMIDYFDVDFYYFGVKVDGYKVVPKAPRLPKQKKAAKDPEKTQKTAELPEEQEKIDQEYEISEDVHTKTGEKIFVVKVVRKLDRSEYLEVADRMKAIGGYYSRYKHGFIFREDPTGKLVAA